MLLTWYRIISLKSKRMIFIFVTMVLLLSIVEIVILETIPIAAKFLTEENFDHSDLNIFYFGKINILLSNETTFLIFSLILVLSAVIMRFCVLSLNSVVAFSIAKELSSNAFSQMLSDPYANQYKLRSDANYISLISNKILYCVNTVINPIFNLFSSAVYLLTFLIYLTIVYPKVSITVFGLVISFYSVAAFGSRSLLIRSSKEISNLAESLVASAKSATSVKLDLIQYNLASHFIGQIERTLKRYYGIQVLSGIVSIMPRYLLEALLLCIGLAFVFGAGSSMINVNNGAVSGGILGAFGYAGLKMLPHVQGVFQNFALITVGWSTANDIANTVSAKICNVPIDKTHHIAKEEEFHRISLKDITVINEDGVIVLDKVNLNVADGDRIAIVGPSGCGKSTLLNVIGGLTKPTSGVVKFGKLQLSDKSVVNYRSNIALVHQNPLIFEGTVGYNVSLSDHMDLIKLDNAMSLTRLSKNNDKVLNLGPEKELLNSGRNISGGQRQRVGLARAIYSGRPILLLDEATSALQEDLANEIIEDLLESNNFSIVVMVTHSKQIAEKFTKIVKLGPYED